MSIGCDEWIAEEDRLRRVRGYISGKLDKGRDWEQKLRRELISTQKAMWSDITLAPSSLNDLDDAAQAWQYQVEIERQSRAHRLSDMQLVKLKKMYDSPYFGRIDFIEDGSNAQETAYIGIGSLMDDEHDAFLIYDWRAPISSMFYDYETGRASYACPSMIVEVDLRLKRQYRITNGRFDFIFDSSVKIDDEILQEVLGKSVDNRMKTIVASIQREQNRIIRDDCRKVLIVFGPAGSGKTSIALHRAAYILYKHRTSIKPEDIIIFSPNSVFNDYISGVLPELGEENIRQTTFMECARKAFGAEYFIEDMNIQMEYLLSSIKDEEYTVRAESMKYKVSSEFVHVLKNYVKYIEKNGFKFDDIVYNGKIIILGDEIDKLYHIDYAVSPPARRLERIRKRLLNIIESHEKERIKQLKMELKKDDEHMFDSEIKIRSASFANKEFEPLKKKVENMTEFAPYNMYAQIFEDDNLFRTMCGNKKLPQHFEKIKEQTLRDLKANFIRYEDTAPIIYIKFALGDIIENFHASHVIIDEVQDYTPLQLEVIKQLFKESNLTLLGDLNQCVNPVMNIGNYEVAVDIFDAHNGGMIKLSKSYRSTCEISNFCRAIISAEPGEYLDRHGEMPCIIKVSEETLYNRIIGDISELKGKGLRSIAVICRTACNSLDLYTHIREFLDVSIITGEDTQYTAGTVIIPSYLSKGLEFDAVIIPDAGEESYSSEEEGRILYTVCTRALHELHLYYKKALTPLLLKVDPSLFTN